jgi:hypothetical protein
MIKLRDILYEGVYDPGILKVVFMAGGPGSGKSRTAGTIFGINPKSMYAISTQSGLKFVSSDIAFEKLLKDAGIDPRKLGSMDPEEFQKLTVGPNSIRSKAKGVRDNQRTAFINSRLGMIIDGTGESYDKIAKTKKELEALGYDAYMIFVNTSLKVAMARNKKRDRVLPDKVVTDAWSAVQGNLGKFQTLFKSSNFEIVDNTADGNVPAETTKIVDKWVDAPTSNPIGKKWMQSELERKKSN